MAFGEEMFSAPKNFCCSLLSPSTGINLVIFILPSTECSCKVQACGQSWLLKRFPHMVFNHIFGLTFLLFCMHFITRLLWLKSSVIVTFLTEMPKSDSDKISKLFTGFKSKFHFHIRFRHFLLSSAFLDPPVCFFSIFYTFNIFIIVSIGCVVG